MRFEDVPPLGRVGFARSGQFEGCYLLVTAEMGRYCIVYTTPPSGSGNTALNTDFQVAPDGLGALMGEWEVEWLTPDEDVRVEAERFGVRDHWNRVDTRTRQSWWRRLLTGQADPQGS